MLFFTFLILLFNFIYSQNNDKAKQGNTFGLIERRKLLHNLTINTSCHNTQLGSFGPLAHSIEDLISLANNFESPLKGEGQSPELTKRKLIEIINLFFQKSWIVPPTNAFKEKYLSK